MNILETTYVRELEERLIKAEHDASMYEIVKQVYARKPTCTILKLCIQKWPIGESEVYSIVGFCGDTLDEALLKYKKAQNNV